MPVFVSFHDKWLHGACISWDSRGAGLQAGLEEMMAGDVWRILSNASKKLPVVNYQKTLLYLIPLHPVTGDLCIPDCLWT